MGVYRLHTVQERDAEEDLLGLDVCPKHSLPFVFYREAAEQSISLTEA